MDAVTVSVVVPNYNYAETLGPCLRAILAQSYPHLDVTVVDDRSTDGSVALATELGVRVTSTDRNGGCGHARNVGAAVTSGDVLCFVDSDMAIAPDAIAQAVAILVSEPEVGAVCGIEDPEPLLHDTAVARYRGLQYHYWSISGEGTVSFLFPAVCAIRRAVYDEIGPFNTALRYTEEVDYGYRISRRYQVRLSSAVRGRHDHDHALFPLLRKLFHRGRARIPLYLRTRRFAKGFETRSRVWGSLAASAAPVTAVLPPLLGPLLGPWWWTVPFGLLGCFLAADAGMYRFVRRRQGVRFLLFFVGVHYLVNLTIAAGIAAGLAQWLLSRSFRALYDASIPREALA